jgi:hypothetical protein
MLAAQALMAQQVVAPTPEQAGPARGQDTGDYNVVNSFEAGYRFAVVDGDVGKYRSDVNYGNGIRLLGSNLTVNSRDGHGRWFDQIVLTTLGLGNDPYESAALRVEKNKLYRYDLLWRLQDYYNPALTIAAGQHFMDTSRRLQDHDFTLFPQSKVKLLLGYSRNVEDGPALSTVQLFNDLGADQGSVFPLFMNVRRVENIYRLGAEVELGKFQFRLQHLWDDFKDDSNYLENGLTSGNDLAPGVTLSQFTRAEPYHGTSPGWIGSLYGGSKTWAINGRFTYVGGRRNFILDQNAIGTTTRVGAENQQVIVGGNAARPAETGDFSVSLFPGSRLSVVNNTSLYSIRIDGNSVYEQFDNASQTFDQIYFRYLGIRAIANATDLQYRIRKWLGVYSGFHYSARQIRDIEGSGRSIPTVVPFGSAAFSQTNHLKVGLFGVRLKPMTAMTINLQSEIGRSDRPFTPVSPEQYHALSGRFDYRVRKLTLSASYAQLYNNNSVNVNNNSVNLSTYSSRARNWSANASWAPHDWFSLDATYMKLHLDTVAGIAFFVPLNNQGLNEIYVSNIHAANFGTHFTVKKRVDLYAGYTITLDTGDGRSSPVPPGTTNPIDLIFGPVETFPLSFQSPLARVSISILPKLRWNAGWQYYNYHEEFGLYGFYQNYHANTGYTSVSWSF